MAHSKSGQGFPIPTCFNPYQHVRGVVGVFILQKQISLKKIGLSSLSTFFAFFSFANDEMSDNNDKNIYRDNELVAKTTCCLAMFEL